jgi:N-acetyl-alpha-D-glucosaminyl L-malate synthase BshA
VNIALVCHAGPGGSSRVAARLASALQARGHLVSLITPAPPRLPIGELSALRVEAFGAKDGSAWSTVLDPTWDQWRLARLERHLDAVVRRDQLQVVHYHYAWPFASIVDRLKRRLGPAAPLFVGTLHGTDVTRAPDHRSATVLSHTDVLTTVSRSYAKLAQERLRLRNAPVVVPNFIDAHEFPRSLDFTDPRARRGRPRLVHVSNFRPVKDPDGIAQIFAGVRARMAAELWLIGDGPGLPALVGSLRRAGLDRDVRVLGYRSDVAQLLGQCDVLVMSSREESFCLAALEAMASGLGIVGTGVGGFAELAEHGETAMLYPPGEYAEGTRLALELLTDAPMRQRMRSAAVHRARAFSATAAVERYEDLYRSPACAPGSIGARVAG